MVSFLNSKRPGRPAKQPTKHMTSISFSESDLAELGHIVAVGQAVLQKRSPVVARLKAAMTPMKVPLPKGL